MRIRRLGGTRAGEMRITRFLRNPAVTIVEMLTTAGARTAGRVAGRHVLAVQDTTDVRVACDNSGVVLHPTIATDAASGALLGLVHAELLGRAGGGRGDPRKHDEAALRARPFADKQSRRWLTGAERAAMLLEAGAAAVTVVADRECDIYEEFALRPAGVDLVIRSGRDRMLADGSLLFSRAAALPEAGRMTVDLPAVPGRSARTAELALRFCPVEIACPRRREARSALPATVALQLLEAREINAPDGAPPAHWRLLTTHRIADIADARIIISYYRQRWTIEQLFRTLKTKGFDIEALRIAAGGPFEKLVIAALIAAITVLQLVRERDGVARRPLADAFDPDDLPVLAALSDSLEGKTARQKNPHPTGSLAFAAWTLARLGGWTGYYGKPGPIVILSGLTRFKAIKHGWLMHNV